MEIKRLILRFRDFSPGVDTVSAHVEVLQKKGAVLWGWWRKAHEPNQLPDLLKVEITEPIPVLLINRYGKKAYQSYCTQILSTAKNNLRLVPRYYQEQSGEVHGWFRLTGKIIPTEYDEELAERLGETTLAVERPAQDVETSSYVFVTESEVAAPAEREAAPSDLQGEERLPCSIRLIHVSDLHFGPDDHNFAFPGVSGVTSAQVSLAEAIHNDYSKNFDGNVDGIIVSGDITSQGLWGDELISNIVKEIRKLCQLLTVDLTNVVVCPGNHDFKRPDPDKREDVAKLLLREATSFELERDFRFFRNQLLGIAVNEPLSTVVIRECQDFVLLIGVLNSANLARTEFVEYGFVGDPLNGVLKEMQGSAKKAYKILVLHHHLIPISPIEEPKSKGVSLTLDAHSILSRAQQEGVQLVMHGHQHIPKIVKTAQAWQHKGKWRGLQEDIFILASGSAGSKWLGEGVANTYSVIDFGVDGVKVNCRRLNRLGGVGSEEFSVELPIQPQRA